MNVGLHISADQVQKKKNIPKITSWFLKNLKATHYRPFCILLNFCKLSMLIQRNYPNYSKLTLLYHFNPRLP